MKQLPSIEQLRERYEYDAARGGLLYALDVVSGHGRVVGRKGEQVGGVRSNDGYISTAYFRRQLLVHRVVWAICVGRWPTHEIDHIDGDKKNNRIENLRDVTRTVNKQNIKRAPRHNKHSKILGAHFKVGAGTWSSSICINGKAKHLGSFKSAEEASAAYLNAKRVYHVGNTL